MGEPNETLAAVAAGATLYTRLDESDYNTISGDVSWSSIADTLRVSQCPPGYACYQHFVNQVLTPGMRLATLPVESLYLPWSELPQVQGGNVHGHYRGDHAVHIEELCVYLDIEIPAEFHAMPDHLVLLAELLLFLDTYSPASDARVFARDHFAWLPSYLDTLRERATLADDAELTTAFEFYEDLTTRICETICNYEKEGD